MKRLAKEATVEQAQEVLAALVRADLLEVRLFPSDEVESLEVDQ